MTDLRPNWDAVLREGALGAEQRALCLALGLVAAGRQNLLEGLFRSALGLGVTPESLREGVLMAHLFAGFPRAIESFHALRRACSDREPGDDREPGQAGDPRATRGRHLFQRIYGERTEPVLDLLGSFSPTFLEAVLEDAYGRILARPHLRGVVRELMAVCALTAGRLPRQLESHLEGARRLGADAGALREVMSLAAHCCDPEAHEEGAARLEQVLANN